MSDALIIGAGISGLSCAWALGRLGVEATVVESSHRAGGVMRTHRTGGYVIEGGPTTLLPKPETLEFIEELGLSPQLVKPRGSRYVYTGGRLRKAPFGAISVTGLLRVLAEPAIRSKSPTDESVFNFFRRRMGPEAADLVSTVVMGIYAGDTKSLSAAAAFPRMVELERKYGSVILGMLRSRKRGTGNTGSATFKDGFETLSNRIVQDVNVRLGVADVRLSDAKAVVLATPAHRAATVLEPERPSLARLLKTVEYAPMIVAAAATPNGSFPGPLRGFGFLVPRTENMHVLGSIFTSALFPDRAPEGMQLLSSFLGGAFEPELLRWPDDRVWDTVGRELKRILRLSSFPQPVMVIRHERALAQYKIGHERFVGALREELKAATGLFLTGNYIAGAGVADCIEQGQQTAQAVAEYLSEKTMKRTAKEIADYVGGQLRGDGTKELLSVASLKNAGASDLSYAEEKFHDQIKSSAAGCVFVRSGEFPGKAVIVVTNPKAAFARAAAWLLATDVDRSGIHPSAVVAPDSSIGEDVTIGAGAVIEAGVRIGNSTVVEAGCYIGQNSRVGSRCILYPRVVLYAGVDVGNGVIIHSGSVIGADGFGFVRDGDHYIKFPQIGGVIIEDDVEIGANTCIDRGSLETTIVRRGAKIDNLVQVAHNVEIGEHTVIASQTGISGSSSIGANAVIGGQVGIGEHARLDDNTIIGGQAGVLNDKRVRGGIVLWGTPARPVKEVLEQQAALARLPRLLREIAELKRRVLGGK